jgi:two-component system sensor histidine kinase KdpD
MLETICEQAERLERLVENLLDMTRVEAGALEVKREWVPVEELVGSALSRVEAAIDGRRVTTSIPTDLPLAPVDPVLFEHALVNLLENAIKYTPAGSPIDIAARRRGDAIELELADRGPGLPAPIEPLFEKFVRKAPGGTGGVGLGLPIARGIARAHGGDVTADNRPGGGARFLINLPLGAERPAAIAPEPEDP